MERVNLMAKRISDLEARRDKNTAETPDIQVYVEKNYFRHVDQLDRWRQEYEQSQAVEKKLADLSRLSYSPIDYAPQLEQIPFKERPIPSFDYLLDEAIVATESKFFIPIAAHIAIMLLLVIILFVSSSTIALRLSGTLGIVVVISLFLVFRQRRKAIEITTEETKCEIERRRQREFELIKEEKIEHENKENERIESVRKLLDGDIGTIMLRLDTVLPLIDLPFPVTVDIDLYAGVPLVKVWLPPKTIIPVQSSELLSSGRVSYAEKEQRTVNKQYLELCCSLLIKIAAVIYENIPSFEKGYLRGMTNMGLSNECLLAASFDRESLISACSASTGLAGLGLVHGKYDCNNMLGMLPIELSCPEEWGDVVPQKLHSLHIKIFK